MLHLNFTPFPYLTTTRLILRQLRPEDEHEIFFLRSDESVNRYIDRSRAVFLEEAKNFISRINNCIKNNESLYWAICLKDQRELIGTICLWNISKELNKAEIGYELHPNFQGRGIMHEAISKVLEFGFGNMNLEVIDACTTPSNTSSIKLLERNNFTRKASGNPEVKEIIYSLDKKSFPEFL